MQEVEQGEHEQGATDNEGRDDVENCHFEFAVKPVVSSGQETSGYEDVDSCVVEAGKCLVGLWVKKGLLPDIG